MTVKITRNKIYPGVGRINKQFQTLPKKAFAYWRKITPRYPYAQRLDEGWSRQAPKGMSEPTFNYIKKIVKGIMRK
jgi:hypothetical protein